MHAQMHSAFFPILLGFYILSPVIMKKNVIRVMPIQRINIAVSSLRRSRKECEYAISSLLMIIIVCIIDTVCIQFNVDFVHTKKNQNNAIHSASYINMSDCVYFVFEMLFSFIPNNRSYKRFISFYCSQSVYLLFIYFFVHHDSFHLMISVSKLSLLYFAHAFPSFRF